MPEHLPSQRKQATILFADLSGFTAVSETLDPEEVRKLVNRYFDRFASAVARYGGTIDKYMGDCVMAVFGVPSAHENDPERACRAALEMREMCRELGEQGARLAVHIGINSGLVVAAPVGAAGSSQFTVMGDAVNLASRLLHEANEDGIVVGESTWASVKDILEFGPRDVRSIKGKSERVAVYALRGLRLKSHPRIARLDLKMVGRSRELALAEQLLGDASQRRGRLLYITGEAGIGKSRLVEEIRRTAAERQFLILNASGQPFESLQPYHLWEQILRQLIGGHEDDTPVSIDLKFQYWVDAHPLLSLHAPALRATLGLAPLEFESLEEDRRVSSIAMGWKALIQALQSSRPVLLVLDDLHWADPASLKLVDLVLDALPALSVVLCCVARPEFEHSWSARSFYQQITLRELSEEEGIALVRSIAADANIDRATEQRIVERAEGNPFYLAELAFSVLQSGTTELPSNIHGVIMQRVDRLEREARQVLETASIIGREFPERILRAVADVEPLETCLTELRRLEFIYEKEIVPEISYLFKHYLTQEATYQSILIERRKTLHREVATAIENIYKESLERYYALLAQHLERAGEYARAFEYYRLAGERAQRTQSEVASLALYERGEKALEMLYETRSGLSENKVAAVLVIAYGLGIGGFGLFFIYLWYRGMAGPPLPGISVVDLVFGALIGLSMLMAGAWLITFSLTEWRFLIYPDKLRLRTKRRVIDIPMENIQKIELITWGRPGTSLKSFMRNQWNPLLVSCDPWRPKLGESSFNQEVRLWPVRLRITRRLKQVVKVECTGQTFKFLGFRIKRRGYYLDMVEGARFFETLERALERYRAVRRI